MGIKKSTWHFRIIQASAQLKIKGVSLVNHGRSKQASEVHAWHHDHNFATDNFIGMTQENFLEWFMVVYGDNIHAREY